MKFAIAAVAASLIAAPAFAADLGVISQPAPAGYEAPARDWTGFYAGIFGGVSTGNFDYSLNLPAPLPAMGFDANGGGGIAGVQIGADYQFDQFVIGAVADIALSNHRAEIGLDLGGVAASVSSELTYLATIRGRAGVAFENLLAYAHGGVAFGKTEQEISGGGVVAFENDVDRVGFTIGAGIEYAVTENISLQTEYAYTSFGDEELVALPGGLGSIDENLSFHTVKAGVNFRF